MYWAHVICVQWVPSSRRTARSWWRSLRRRSSTSAVASGATRAPSMGSVHVAIACAVGVARSRPAFCAQMIQALEAVHANMPPNAAPMQVCILHLHSTSQRILDVISIPTVLLYSKSSIFLFIFQVTSLRKHLRSQLVLLLKFPGAAQHLQTIIALLKDLGMTENEVPN